MILRLVAHKGVARPVHAATNLTLKALRYVEVSVRHVSMQRPGSGEGLAADGAERRGSSLSVSRVPPTAPPFVLLG